MLCLGIFSFVSVLLLQYNMQNEYGICSKIKYFYHTMIGKIEIKTLPYSVSYVPFDSHGYDFKTKIWIHMVLSQYKLYWAKTKKFCANTKWYWPSTLWFYNKTNKFYDKTNLVCYKTNLFLLSKNYLLKSISQKNLNANCWPAH